MNLKITYEELFELIMQLPVKQLTRLKEDLASLPGKKKPPQRIKNFQEFLLQGPLMTDNQYEQFLENRKYINEWMER